MTKINKSIKIYGKRRSKENNYYKCPISCELFSNRKYINPELLYPCLPKVDHPDEFFIYIPDVAIPGIEPYSTLISNYGKLYNLSSNTTICISKNKYGENCANFRRYSINLKKIVQRYFPIKRIEKISFDFYYNILPLNFLNTDVKYIDNDLDNLNYYNLIWQGEYKYSIVD